MPGLLTLIGSGEVSAGMTCVHRHLLAQPGASARLVFLDTPAGFELGARGDRRTFPRVLPAALRPAAGRGRPPLAPMTRRRPSPPPLQVLAGSSYILAGPGSPSYAVRHWRDSPVFDAVVDRWQAGAQLVFASSAAIAISAYALPGLRDLQGRAGTALGRRRRSARPVSGSTWPSSPTGTTPRAGRTTRGPASWGCERFERLRAMLPAECGRAGDRRAHRLHAGSAGRDGRGERPGRDHASWPGTLQRRHVHGETFPFDELRSAAPGAPAQAPAASTSVPCVPDAVHERMAETRDLLARGEVAPGLRLMAEAAPPDLAPLLALAARSAESLGRADPPPEKLVTLLIELRDALRTSKQWQLSDQIRDGLSVLGIRLQDTPTEHDLDEDTLTPPGKPEPGAEGTNASRPVGASESPWTRQLDGDPQPRPGLMILQPRRVPAARRPRKAIAPVS